MKDSDKEKLHNKYVRVYVTSTDRNTPEEYVGIVKKVHDDFIELHGEQDHIALFAGVDQGIGTITDELRKESIGLGNKAPLLYINEMAKNAYSKKGALLDQEQREYVRSQGEFFF